VDDYAAAKKNIIVKLAEMRDFQRSSLALWVFWEPVYLSRHCTAHNK